MSRPLDHATARALLEWQLEMGATEAIGDAPVNRYDLPKSVPESAPEPAPGAKVPRPRPLAAVADAPRERAVAAAEAAAAGASTLDELCAAMAAYEGCDLKKGARNLVFADGNARARVMIIGEAPGRDEDRAGRPFVGRAGQLLDRMLAAIGLSRDAASRDQAVYITNVLPWRPPQNRQPSPEEIAMMLPFVKRHVALVSPEVLVLMGNTPCQALLGRHGILRMRGHWSKVLGIAVLPMVHPAYLLRTPLAKREAWQDLLSLKAHLLKAHLLRAHLQEKG